VLIDGNNGAGKSTIFKAIEWCLYNVRTITKNKNSICCNSERTKVEIIMGDIKITRMKDPETLEVSQDDNIYHEDAAQAIINKIFGVKIVWQASSYMKQKSSNILLCGSAEDKQKLIYNLAFGNEDDHPDKFMENIVKSLRECGIDRNMMLGSIKALEDTLLNDPPSEKQLILMDNKSLKKSLDHLKLMRIMNDKLLSREMLRRDDKLKNDKEREIITSQIEEYKNDLEKLGDEPASIDEAELYNIKDKVTTIAEIQSINSRMLKFDDLENILPHENFIRDVYRIFPECSLNNVIDRLVAAISRYEAKVHNLEVQENNRKSVLVDKEIKRILEHNGKWKEHQDAISKLPTKPEFYGKGFMFCPCCNMSLSLKNDELIKGENLSNADPKDIIKDIRDYDEAIKIVEITKINRCDDNIPEKIPLMNLVEVPDGDDIHSSLLSLAKKLSTYDINVNMSIREAKSILDNKDDYVIMKAKLKELKKRRGDQPISILKDSLSKILKDKDAYDTYHKSKDNLESHLKSLDIRRGTIPPQITEDVDEQINILKGNLDDVQIEISDCEESLRKKNIRDNINDKRGDLDVIERRIEDLETLMRCIKEVESETMADVLISIESQTNLILKRIFEGSEDSMVFRICNDKIKRGRITFDTKVYYRGIGYAGFGDLSGGEETILSLALTLGIGNATDVGFIMLDEALNSLSENMLERCLEVLFDLSKDKTVINVLHLCNRSLYDEIIEI